MTIVKVMEIAQECMEMKRGNAALMNQNTDLDANVVEGRAVEGTMRG